MVDFLPKININNTSVNVGSDSSGRVVIETCSDNNGSSSQCEEHLLYTYSGADAADLAKQSALTLYELLDSNFLTSPTLTNPKRTISFDEDEGTVIDWPWLPFVTTTIIDLSDAKLNEAEKLAHHAFFMENLWQTGLLPFREEPLEEMIEERDDWNIHLRFRDDKLDTYLTLAELYTGAGNYRKAEIFARKILAFNLSVATRKPMKYDDANFNLADVTRIVAMTENFPLELISTFRVLRDGQKKSGDLELGYLTRYNYELLKTCQIFAGHFSDLPGQLEAEAACSPENMDQYLYNATWGYNHFDPTFADNYLAVKSIIAYAGWQAETADPDQLAEAEAKYNDALRLVNLINSTTDLHLPLDGGQNQVDEEWAYRRDYATWQIRWLGDHLSSRLGLSLYAFFGGGISQTLREAPTVAFGGASQFDPEAFLMYEARALTGIAQIHRRQADLVFSDADRRHELLQAFQVLTRAREKAEQIKGIKAGKFLHDGAFEERVTYDQMITVQARLTAELALLGVNVWPLATGPTTPSTTPVSGAPIFAASTDEKLFLDCREPEPAGRSWMETIGTPVNGTPKQSFGFKPRLQGKYVGIHYNDAITKEDLVAARDQFGQLDIQLKFLSIQSGWEYPETEIELATEFNQAMFLKYEPQIPTAPAPWELDKENLIIMDKQIPLDYYHILLQLASSAYSNRPNDLPQLLGQSFSYLGQTELASLADDITNEYYEQNHYLDFEFNLILKNSPAGQAKVLILLTIAERSNNDLRSALAAALAPTTVLATDAMLDQLVARAASDIDDIKLQIDGIMQDHGIEPKKNEALRNKLAIICQQSFNKLINDLDKELPPTAKKSEIYSLAETSRLAYENYLLQFDLVMRQHNVALDFSAEKDPIIIQGAKKSIADGRPTYDTWGAEMNGYGYDGKTGTWHYWYTAGRDRVKYILGFRHRVDLEWQVGVRNKLYGFNPHVLRGPEKDFTRYYPGDNYIDFNAFDVYGDDKHPSLVALTEESIRLMETFLHDHNLQFKPYAIGEWGTKNKQQFEQMLSFFEATPELVFHIYYNTAGTGGDLKNYQITDESMRTRFASHILGLPDKHRYNFDPTNYQHNPDLFSFTSTLPQVPKPTMVIRDLTPLTPAAAYEQPIDPTGSAGFTPGALPDLPLKDPVDILPPRSLDETQLRPYEQATTRLEVGNVLTLGTRHRKILSAPKIKRELDHRLLSLSEIQEVLGAIRASTGGTISRERISRNLFLSEHPEFQQIQHSSPLFAPYFSEGDQLELYWENTLVLLGIYAQEAIESNDQTAIREVIELGEIFAQRIADQEKCEVRDRTVEEYSPSGYRQAALTLIMAEAYSQLRDASAAQYQLGITYAEESVELFQAAAGNGGADYQSIAKAALVAADLHMKLAQDYSTDCKHEEANVEYQTAERLYSSVAQLDYQHGEGLEINPHLNSNIEVSASAADIIEAMEKNIQRFFINDEEAIVTAHALFRITRGTALLKMANFYLENGFKSPSEEGYEDVIQNMTYAYAGLNEALAASPYGDTRFLRAWGETTMAKLTVKLADSLAYSTSELAETKAKKIYQKALDQLKQTMPDLFTADQLNRLQIILKTQDLSYETLVNQEMAKLEKTLKSTFKYPGGVEVKKPIVTTQFMTHARELLRQTHTVNNFRISFGQELFHGAERHNSMAQSQLKDTNLYGHQDHLDQKAKVLYAQTLLMEVSLAIRFSRYSSFDGGPNTLINGAKKIMVDPDDIKDLQDKLDVVKSLLPATSYFQVELALTRATLNMSRLTISRTPAARLQTYDIIDALTQNPPDLTRSFADPVYRTIVMLESEKEKIMAQPEPNRSIQLTQLETKLSLAYIILAANIVETLDSGMEGLARLNDKNEKEYNPRLYTDIRNYISRILAVPQRVLTDRAIATEKQARQSTEPLLFDVHELRTELFHQLAIIHALQFDETNMYLFLDQAKTENALTNSYFNVYYRSWMLNKFAIPKPKVVDLGKNRNTSAQIRDIDDLIIDNLLIGH